MIARHPGRVLWGGDEGVDRLKDGPVIRHRGHLEVTKVGLVTLAFFIHQLSVPVQTASPLLDFSQSRLNLDFSFLV